MASFGPFSLSLGGHDQTLQLYSNAYVTIDGTLAANEASVVVDKKSRLQEIVTLGAGFAGMSLGAPICEVSIESAVPSTDLDLHPDLFLRTGETVELGIVVAGRQTVCKAFITDATYSHSVNKETQLHMKFLCRFEEFE